MFNKIFAFLIVFLSLNKNYVLKIIDTKSINDDTVICSATSNIINSGQTSGSSSR